MNMFDEWYHGAYAEYRDMPWLYQHETTPLMPWTVVDIQPCGYIVFRSAGGTKFKMLMRPAICVGDIVA